MAASIVRRSACSQIAGVAAAIVPAIAIVPVNVGDAGSITRLGA